MKIQNLAVIFIIIILPISLILTAYVQSQVKTLGLQVSYDSKLNNATYDALKAFQLNTFNSDTSDLSNSKIRDIEASANTFFTSLASNFNMSGYNQDILKDYVPALVYTMYDGYYIYSPYTNKLSENEKKEDTTYKDGEEIYGLKPYVYYSCRYRNVNCDVVITYTLDNYITIQGKVNDEVVYKSGYLLDNIEIEGTKVKYRDVEINNETTKEFINEEQEQLPYIKINGVKYYYKNNQWYTVRNGKKISSNALNIRNINNIAGQKYYKEAKKFSKWVKENLGDLKTTDAVGEEGYGSPFGDDRNTGYKIFKFYGEGRGDNYYTSIEDPDSNFNQHRLAVIRYSIEKNLSIAIANYNNYTGVQTDFRMPQLKEDEWSKIINNISIISFLQGLNIGGKVYNGYSIINNTKNNEYVSENSIYLADTNEKGYYYEITDKDNVTGENDKEFEGILNIDFERRSYTDQNGATKYFFPKKQLGSYSSIVNQSNVYTIYKDNIYAYMAGTNKDKNEFFYVKKAAQAYFTALGRERYSMYRTNPIE